MITYLLQGFLWELDDVVPAMRGGGFHQCEVILSGRFHQLTQDALSSVYKL